MGLTWAEQRMYLEGMGADGLLKLNGQDIEDAREFGGEEPDIRQAVVSAESIDINAMVAELSANR